MKSAINMSVNGILIGLLSILCCMSVASAQTGLFPPLPSPTDLSINEPSLDTDFSNNDVPNEISTLVEKIHTQKRRNHQNYYKILESSYKDFEADMKRVSYPKESSFSTLLLEYFVSLVFSKFIIDLSVFDPAFGKELGVITPSQSQVKKFVKNAKLRNIKNLDDFLKVLRDEMLVQERRFISEIKFSNNFEERYLAETEEGREQLFYDLESIYNSLSFHPLADRENPTKEVVQWNAKLKSNLIRAYFEQWLVLNARNTDLRANQSCLTRKGCFEFWFEVENYQLLSESIGDSRALDIRLSVPDKDTLERALKVTMRDRDIRLFDFKVPKRVCVVNTLDIHEIYRIVQLSRVYLENGESEEDSNRFLSSYYASQLEIPKHTVAEIYENSCAWFDEDNNIVVNAKDKNVAGIVSSDRQFQTILKGRRNFINSDSDW